MGLAANPIPAVVLLLCLLAAALPASAKLKTTKIHFDNFFINNSDTHKLQAANSATSAIGRGALQLTPETENVGFALFTNQSGRILYKILFKLWEGGSDAYSDPVASFSTSFLVNMYRLKEFPTPGEGMAFVVAPDLKIPPNSSGEYLGLTNAATDGNASNHLIAVELDTFIQDFDPNSHHVGLNINSVRHNGTASLTTPLDYELVAPLPTGYFFNVWIDYDGNKKVIKKVYLARQESEEAATPLRPDTPILTSDLDLRRVVNQNSYFGFSASTGNAAQLNCVLRWNMTVKHYYDEKKLITKICLAAGIPTAVLLPALVGSVYYSRKRWLSRRSDRRMSGKVKSMPGMPKEYQYKELQKATNNFDETRKLGQGGYGVVYKGYLENQKGLEVAVKMFSRESLKGQEDFFQELTIINQLRHKHLVPLQGWCHKNGKLLLVYDYMPNGSLDEHLFGDANSTPLRWNLCRKIIIGVASALHHLHNEYQRRVVHRDIKSNNIMLDAEFNAKLGDFGLARALDKEKTSYTEAGGVPGTRGYMAPEYIFTGKATEQSDVYAFGAVLLEVVCGRRPGTQIGTYPWLVDWVWALHREGQLLEAVDNRLGEDYVAEEAQRFLLLGLACSHPIASERPKTQEIVQMLSSSMPVPCMPSFKPPYALVPVPMLEKDIIPATTTDTMFFTAADCIPGSAPVAINPEIQRPSCDSYINII